MKYLEKTVISTPPNDAYRKGYAAMKWGPKKKPKKESKK